METLSDALSWLTSSANYSGETGIVARIIGHVLISTQSVALAAVLAVPIAFYVGHRRRYEFFAVTTGNLGRALPSFGVLGLVFPFTFDIPGELGYWATFFALFLLAVPPILANTYVGIRGVDPDVVESARGIGYTERDVLLRLEVPLAAPLIVAGLRTALVQVVATATLGAYAGWQHGLGSFIRSGFAQGEAGRDQLLGGAILVALLAIATEIALGLLGRVVGPRRASRPRPRLFRSRTLRGKTA
ncbi:MAG: ABC transporter permease [Actinomycetota bacterium]|nr:ABC transporter permease [Actinomycetota bacterium]